MEKNVYELGGKRLLKRCRLDTFKTMLIDETRCERWEKGIMSMKAQKTVQCVFKFNLGYSTLHYITYYMWTRHVHTLGFCEWLVVAAFLMGWRILLWPGDHWARPVHLLVTLVGNKPGWQDKIGWMIPFDSECEETAPTRLSNGQREGGGGLLCASVHGSLHWLLK